MSVSRWILLASFAVCAGALLYHLFKVIASARPNDPTQSKGNLFGAVAYSFTGAMSPLKKESARRHVPTYVLGLLFHGGVFLAFAWLVAFFFALRVPVGVGTVSVLVLAATTLSGMILLVKRITRRTLRYFSTPDDYFSNVLVAGFQAMTVLALVSGRLLPLLFVYASALLLYVPLGKLRHAVYFFLARIYLGHFFGKRGVWGSRKNERWEAQNR